MCPVRLTNQVAHRGPFFAIAKPALETACTWYDSSSCGLPSVIRMRPQYEMRCFRFVAPTHHCCAPILVGALPVLDGVCALRFVVPGMTLCGWHDFRQIPPERGGGGVASCGFGVTSPRPWGIDRLGHKCR